MSSFFMNYNYLIIILFFIVSCSNSKKNNTLNDANIDVYLSYSDSVNNKIVKDSSSLDFYERVCKHVENLNNICFYDSALMLGQRIEKKIKNTNQYLYLKLKNQIAFALYNKGAFRESIRILIENKMLNDRKMKNKEIEHEIDLFLGVNYFQLEKIDSSFFYFTNIDNDEEFKNDVVKMNVLINLGSIEDYLYDYQKAINYYLRALKYAKRKSNYHVCTIYNNIGIAYEGLDSLDKAIEYLNKSISIGIKYKYYENLGNPFSNKGLVYERKGKFIEALYCFKKAAYYDSLYNPRISLLNSYNQISRVLMSLKRYHEALLYLEAACKQKNKVNSDYLVTLDQLSQCHNLLGNSKQAYKYLREYMVLNDSLSLEESKAELKNIEQKYQVLSIEKKLLKAKNEKEIIKEKLRLNNKYLWFIITLFTFIVLLFIFLIILIIKRNKIKQENIKHRLEKSIIEINHKLLTSQIDHHFISNILNGIQLYFVNGDTVNASKYLSKFSQLMRKILISSSHNIEPLNESIIFLKLYLDLEQFRFQNKFVYKIDFAENIVTEDILIPPLIFQPIVENSIKHAFEGIEYVGEINVYFSTKDNFLIAQISDNGKGMTKTQNQDPDQDRKSYGLAISQKRILLWGKELGFPIEFSVKKLYEEKESNFGTLVIIKIPYLYDHD